MGTYNYLGTEEDWRKLKNSLDLGKSPRNEINTINENALNLQKINGRYNDFLSKGIAKELDEAANMIQQANNKYDSLISAIENAAALVQKSEQNGNVESESSAKYTQQVAPNSTLESNTYETPTREAALEITNIPNSSLESSLKENESTSNAMNISNIPDSSLTSSLGDLSSERTTLGITNEVDTFSKTSTKENGLVTELTQSNSTNNSNIYTTLSDFGKQKISVDTWNNLSKEEQTNVINKLQSAGYTEIEIKHITEGMASSPKVIVDGLSMLLDNSIEDCPEIREDLINRFGFDIFDKESKVDKERLALALILDGKNNEYSLIEYLHQKYNIDIIDDNSFNSIIKELEILLRKYPELRKNLEEKYGFDIFNENENVDKNNLFLLLLVDSQSETDNYNVLKDLNFFEKKSGISTLSGVSLLGATSFGSKILERNRKNKNSFNNKNIMIDINENGGNDQ